MKEWQPETLVNDSLPLKVSRFIATVASHMTFSCLQQYSDTPLFSLQDCLFLQISFKAQLSLIFPVNKISITLRLTKQEISSSTQWVNSDFLVM